VFFNFLENILQGLSNVVALSVKLFELANPFGEARANIYKVRIVKQETIFNCKRLYIVNVKFYYKNHKTEIGKAYR